MTSGRVKVWWTCGQGATLQKGPSLQLRMMSATCPPKEWLASVFPKRSRRAEGFGFSPLLRNFSLGAGSRVAAIGENTTEWLLRFILCSHCDYLPDSAPTVSNGKPFPQTRCKMKSLPMVTLPQLEFGFCFCKDHREKHLKNRPVCNLRQICKYRYKHKF